MAYTTIDRPSDNFRIKLYTGNGSTQSITFDESTAMQPDCTWIKVRNDANVTLVHDVIRGATKEIYTPLTNAEATDTNGLTAFNSNGFSVGSANGVNRNGYNFVNWSWKANGTGVSNTSGTISSTVSANTTTGFSIVTYTGNGTSGATIGHGLGVAPNFIIIKCRNTTEAWPVWSSALAGNTSYVRLNATDAVTTATDLFNSTTPTSSLITLGNGGFSNTNTRTYVAYVFANVKGYSKFGSFIGNGSDDGTFIYTGFKPAWFMYKKTNTTDNWYMLDNKRNTFNVVNKWLDANTSDAEDTFTFCDFLSNGIKMRSSSANGSGDTYIYMAFAENPFVSSKGIPTTAR